MSTILFDIDGTLLLFRGVGRAAMERAIEETFGIPRALEGFSFAGSTDGAIANHAAPGRPREALWRRYLGHLERMVEAFEDPSPFPGAVELLDELARRGARIGLLTGNLRAGALIKLRAARLLDRFDLALSAFAEDGDARDDLARAARRRCGEGPIAVVGDSLADISCARAIGARVLAVATGPQPLPVLREGGADLLVEGLSGSLADWLLGPHGRSAAPAPGRRDSA